MCSDSQSSKSARTCSLKVETLYLLELLQEHFTGAKVRVRTAPVQQRALDFDPRDTIDPDSFDQLTREGVEVHLGSQTHFFETQWVIEKQYSKIQTLIHDLEK